MRSPARTDNCAPASTRSVAHTRPVCAGLALALVLVTAALYAPVRHHDFVNFDDYGYIAKNPNVAAGLTGAGFVWVWTAPTMGYWHPLTMLSHMLDVQLFGLDPGAHHLISVGFHIVNTLLLFGVLVQMTAQPWRSAFVAALFALHPLHVESVAWASERKDVLSTFFWMLTVLVYVGYSRRPTARRVALMMATFAAALLSKAMVVTLPFTLLLLDVWPLHRIDLRRLLAGRSNGHPASDSFTRLLMEKVPLFALSVPISVIMVLTQRQVGAISATSMANVGNAVVAYATYLLQTLWPARLAVLYIFEWPLPAWQIGGSIVLLSAVTALALWNTWRYPYVLVGWLWYLGTLVPALGVVRVGAQAMADRFTYVPLIGIFIIIAWGIPDLLGAWKYRQVVCTIAAVLALTACTLVSAHQLSFWKNTTTLFQRAIDVTRYNYVAHATIARELVAQGKRDAAVVHFSEVLRIADRFSPVEPYYSEAHYNVGLALAARGDLDGAKQHYQAALRFNPSLATAHSGLGIVLAAEGDAAGAVAEDREALRLDPELGPVHTHLAISLEDLGRTAEAITHYAAAVRLEPQRAELHSNLAAALANAGRLQEAGKEFGTALQLKPQLVEARFGLATTEFRAGRVGDAVAALNDLLLERPDWTAVAATLAWLLATTDDAGVRNGERAVHVAEDAAQRTQNHDADVLNSLAAAYAEVGRFTDATTVASQALALARASGRTSLVNALTDRMAQYRAGHPVREAAGH